MVDTPIRRKREPKPDKPDRDKPNLPDKPAPAPEPAPESVPGDRPSGPIATLAPWNGKPFGVEWWRITRWLLEMESASREFGGVPVSRIAAHIVIESQGEPSAMQVNAANGNSYGLMQVVPRYWRADIERLSGRAYGSEDAAGRALLGDPFLAIRAGTLVLAAFYRKHGTWDAASSAFFTGTPNWRGQDGVNGTTGHAYKVALDSLIAEWDAADGAPTPAPEPEKPVDPLRVIMGGPYAITQEWAVTSNAADYSYGIGHGLNGHQHTGIDIAGDPGQPLYAPGDGVVTCGATGWGAGSWQTGCAAFNDYMGQRVGRVEILLDSGVSVILGHSSTSLVKPGQRVTRGQQVATVGGMNGWHVHLETRVWEDGTYRIVDPRKALGGNASTGSYAEGQPIAQPDAETPVVTLRAVKAEVPVLQRGYRGSSPVRKALDKGETFQSGHQVYGDDWYYVDRETLGRVRARDVEAAS